jgi:tetratricopeptide (TPR) repeat protein
MRRLTLVTVLVASLAAPAAPVIAKGKPKPASKEEKEKKAKVEALFQEAEANYRTGDYEQALAGYKEAYELSKKPSLLFNLGQCYRMLKRYDEALFAYRLYLHDVPSSPVADSVKARIKELEEEQQRAKEEAERKLAEAEKARQEAEKALIEASQQKRGAGLLIGTAAFSALGAAFGIQTLLLSQELEGATEILDATRRKGLALAVASDASFVAASGTFLVWLVLRKKRAAESSPTAEVKP